MSTQPLIPLESEPVAPVPVPSAEPTPVAPPPTNHPAVPCTRPAPPPADQPHLVFTRGKTFPRAIAWLGFSSFWGHMWHLAASVIATEDIDARDWMQATDPDELTRRVAETLGVRDADEALSLTEHLGRDVWLDYVSDTGDDASVGGAVADLLFRTYEVDDDDGGTRVLPRGDVLLFGGDTAYPVATEIEILNRVCVPFNQVLKDRQDGRPRVLMGIPGNHDWYDGLDGFSRMFRARAGKLDRASVLPGDAPRATPAGATAEVDADRGGRFGYLAEWVEAFTVGKYVNKRPALPLLGYQTVQKASYFCLKLAPEMDLWGVDRQLRRVDYQQHNFFMAQRNARPAAGQMIMIPDPAYAFLEPYVGMGTLGDLDVDLERDGALVVSGDVHHYCRQEVGNSIHMTAGGGGAFLHPARINRRGFDPPAAEFPGPRATMALALQVPWQIAAGRAGFIVHVAILVLYLPILLAHLVGDASVAGSVAVGALATVVCAFLGGWRQAKAHIIGGLALLCGVWVGAVPMLAEALIVWLGGAAWSDTAHLALALLLSVYPATLGFGAFLMVLTIVGLEQNQAFSTLAHPGYKHVVRMRVRHDGSGIDAWVFGKVDTLADDAEIVLVDRYAWNNPARADQNGQPPSSSSSDAADGRMQGPASR
ncbi:MAG: hypothetical protein AAF715_31240 [Myxococcota bacterium]